MIYIDILYMFYILYNYYSIVCIYKIHQCIQTAAFFRSDFTRFHPISPVLWIDQDLLRIAAVLTLAAPASAHHDVALLRDDHDDK